MLSAIGISTALMSPGSLDSGVCFLRMIDAVNAFNAAVEMELLSWPYDMAYALVVVKRSTVEDAAWYVQQERGLVMRYAELDEGGLPVMASPGRFVFKDAGMGAEYERERDKLCGLEVPDPVKLRVRAPAEIRPAWLEALECYMEFVAE